MEVDIIFASTLTPYFVFWDMDRHSKATKKNICWIAHACTYKYTTKTLAGPASNTKINRQEKASPPITSDEEQELNGLEYSASGPGD